MPSAECGHCLDVSGLNPIFLFCKLHASMSQCIVGIIMLCWPIFKMARPVPTYS